MLKRSVIAADITNLTDARYFAARGVDYLHYNLNHIGINEVMAITEWVEGVKTLVQMSEENIHLVDEVLLRVAPFAVGSKNPEVLDKILNYVKEGSIFYLFPSEKEENGKIIITHVDNINSTNYQIAYGSEVLAFAEASPSPEGLNQFLDQNADAGIVLRGSFEIEVGLKSFDNIDALLDILED